MNVIRSIAAPAISIARTVRSGLASAAGVRRSALLNGAAAGLGLAGAAALGAVFGSHGSAVMLGAICVSVADAPASPAAKARRVALAWVLSALAMAAAVATLDAGWAEALTIAVVGFCAAMATAYGRSAIPIGVAALLALVFARSVATPDGGVLATSGWFAFGGLYYGLFAIAIAPLLARQTKRMLLRESLDGLSAFLRAQRTALDEQTAPRAVYEALIDAQAALAERIQAARDVVFANVAGSTDRLYAALLVIFIDVFEVATSEQADLETLLDLRREHGESIRSLRALLLLAASDLDRFSRALADGGWRETASLADQRALIARFGAIDSFSDPRHRQAIRATANKIGLLFAHIDRMADVRADPALAGAVIAGIDLDHFVQTSIFDLRTLTRQLNLRAPVARFAVRLSLALLCGYLVGAALPYTAHGTWILLTVALVMRANYSITKQRRDERLLGNILGCALAAAVLVMSPSWLLPVVMLLAASASHAFVVQSYLVSSIASCVMALTLIHVAEPNGDAVFLAARIVDTAIGAAIAHLFSFVLPTWERAMIAAQIPDLVRAAADYARQSLSPLAEDEAYRLARRRIHDATASLSAASRRMIDEPASPRAEPRVLSGLLAASYSFVAELASIQLYLRARRGENDLNLAAALARAQRLVALALDRAGEPTVSPLRADEDAFSDAGALSRRLSRAVVVARRLAALASESEAVETAAARTKTVAG